MREPIVIERKEILDGLVVQLERERWDGKEEEVWYIYNNGKRHTTATGNNAPNDAAYAILLALEARFDGINSQFARFASRMLELDEENGRVGNRVDVIAVNFDSGEILWIEPDRTEANAEAVIKMAIARQGVEDRFYVAVPAGKYHKGDKYEG